MSIQVSQEQRGYLEQVVRGRTKPTRREMAIALLRLAEGDSAEQAAQHAGIAVEEVATLASDFTERGLDGIGLGGGEAGAMKVPSLQDDSLFEQYRKILKARRKLRARQEDSAE
jgi:hypothetical protein